MDPTPIFHELADEYARRRALDETDTEELPVIDDDEDEETTWR